jgi:hypothetical protein
MNSKIVLNFDEISDSLRCIMKTALSSPSRMACRVSTGIFNFSFCTRNLQSERVRSMSKVVKEGERSSGRYLI